MGDINKRVKKILLDKLRSEYAMMGDKHTAPHEPPENRELNEFPQNWMQGRVSDTHTKLHKRPRAANNKTNFYTKNSGNPDIEDEDRNDDELNTTE